MTMKKSFARSVSPDRLTPSFKNPISIFSQTSLQFSQRRLFFDQLSSNFFIFILAKTFVGCLHVIFFQKIFSFLSSSLTVHEPVISPRTPIYFKEEFIRFLTLFLSAISDKRYIDHSQRVVNPPKKAPSGGVNAAALDDALSTADSPKKKKMKAYRRSDSTASGGSRSRSATKELALPPDDSLMCPPSFVTGLKPDLDAKDGTRLELKVQVKGDPDPQVTWTKDGAPLSSNQVLEVKYKNGIASVIIAEVFPEDAGRYACKATNTKGSVETSSRVKIVPNPRPAGATNGSVNGSSASISPRIFKHVSSAIVKDGDPVKLEATVACDSRFDVVWLHNEKEIKPSKDFVYKSTGNTHVLEIQEIFPEDCGTYTCEAFNDVGECYTTCTLVVDVPGEDLPQPTFKTYPKSMTVDKNGSATFVAELSQTPKQVTWMKDGKTLKEIPMKNRMVANKNKLSLDIMECREADAGQYALIVTGEKGETKAAFSLNVH